MLQIKYKYFFPLFVLLHFSIACSNPRRADIEQEISGKVIKVKDGDTIDILFNGKPLTIRLAHIDCPEKNQPFGSVTKRFTSDLCFGQIVTIENEKKFDRYNRLIGVVINEKGDTVNKELVKAGLAWHYKKYSTDEEYDKLEFTARGNKVGLWRDGDPTPPWNWR